MTLRSDAQILVLFFRQPTLVLSIHKISLILKKPYPYTYKKVKDILQRGILHQQKAGNAILCSLNLDSPLALHYLGIVQKQPNIPELASLRRQLLSQAETGATPLLLYHTKTRRLLLVHDSPLAVSPRLPRKSPEAFWPSIRKDVSHHMQYVCLFGRDLYFARLTQLIKEERPRYAP